jgi:hypothetical protein
VRLEPIFEQIQQEYDGARRRFGPFNSTHEGYAVILEELDELWEAIRIKGHTDEDRYLEALQVATMAVAFLAECCPPMAKPWSKNS